VKSSTRFAIIGSGVAVAAAGVITLLVIKPGKEEEPETLAARSAAVPALAKKDLEGGVVKPWDAKPPTAEELKQAAADQKAEQEEAAKEAAKAEAALAKAQDDNRRTTGILGSTALQQGGAFASLTGTGTVSSGFDDTNIYGGLLGNEAGEMNGGFGYGRSGFGPGGGGTGWGTIGTGRYGSIGHGSGTSSGYGVGGGRGGMRGRAAAVPTISIGQPMVVPTVASATDPGNLDKAIVRRYVKRNIQKLQYCYEKELLAKADLSGTVTTQFTITESGVVGSASASGVDPTVSSCMAGVIKGIEFPKPKGTGGVTVTYPFTVRPAGS